VRPYGLSVYLFETYDMYEERMRTELQRWEAAGHVTKNSSDASSREHCKFTKPVICWCLYHVNKSHREWAQGRVIHSSTSQPFVTYCTR